MTSANASSSSIPIDVTTLPPAPKVGSRSPGEASAAGGNTRIKNKTAYKEPRRIADGTEASFLIHLFFITNLLVNTTNADRRHSRDFYQFCQPCERTRAIRRDVCSWDGFSLKFPLLL